MIDVAIVTTLSGSHTVTQREGEALLAALIARGLRAEIVAWDQPGVDWTAVRAAIIRSAFNWHLRRQRFLDWIDATARVVRIWNAPRLIHWGASKTYLFDLQSRGLPIVPSLHVPAGSPVGSPWPDMIVKPVTGIASFGVRRISAAEAGVADRELLVQPYLASIETRGELSAVFVDGELTHGLRRVPAPGDFRAHFIFGAGETAVTLDAGEAALCRRVLDAVGEGALCGRIDLIASDAGEWLVSEVELVAPMLYFHHGPAACERLADAMARALS